MVWNSSFFFKTKIPVKIFFLTSQMDPLHLVFSFLTPFVVSLCPCGKGWGNSGEVSTAGCVFKELGQSKRGGQSGPSLFHYGDPTFTSHPPNRNTLLPNRILNILFAESFLNHLQPFYLSNLLVNAKMFSFFPSRKQKTPAFHRLILALLSKKNSSSC